MPINGVLDLQRRSVQIGEIRMGYSIEVAGKKGRQPMRSDTWRFTTASEHAAQAIVARYEGSTMAPWPRRKGRWEVITNRTALDVWVPPRGEAVDANMELWDGPRCLRRCDGISMSFPSARPCMCPQPSDPGDPDSVARARNERVRLAGLRPPQACKPLTRINVTIPDLPGLLGVWKLNTGSENAAVETADSGEAMAIAREGGVYLPAVLRIEWRTRSADGKPYPVPVLQIGLSMREIAAGALPAGPSGLLRQLQGADAGGQQRAITAAPSPDVPRPGSTGAAAKATSGPASADRETGPEAPSQELAEDERRYQLAQAIADRARTATTGAQLTECAAAMKRAKADEEFVYVTDDRVSGPCEPLGEFLREVWREKAREGGR